MDEVIYVKDHVHPRNHTRSKWGRTKNADWQRLGPGKVQDVFVENVPQAVRDDYARQCGPGSTLPEK